jgi:hypothetical protein
MPGFDRTGPMGNGPMTGGGFGRCGGGGRVGFGRGAGRGYGRGRGACRRFRDSGSGFFGGARMDSTSDLQVYAEDLESELSRIRRRMKALAEERSPDRSSD